MTPIAGGRGAGVEGSYNRSLKVKVEEGRWALSIVVVIAFCSTDVGLMSMIGRRCRKVCCVGW